MFKITRTFRTTKSTNRELFFLKHVSSFDGESYVEIHPIIHNGKDEGKDEVEYDLSEYYYLKDGKKVFHREDGPAIQLWNDKGELIYEAWLFDGEFHRSLNQIAVYILDDSDYKLYRYEEWWVDGKRHRNDGGEAISHYDLRADFKLKQYWYNGRLHRKYAPDDIESNKNFAAFKRVYDEVIYAWYIDGNMINIKSVGLDKD